MSHRNLFDEKKSSAPVLAAHIVFGNKRDVEKILANEINRALLLEPVKVLDHSKRLHEGTPLQIALKVFDIGHIELGVGIANIILGFFEQYFPKDHEKIVAEQIKSIIPKDWKDQEEKQVEADLQALNKVFDAAEKAKSIEECKEPIKVFHQYLESSKNRPILCFNPMLLIAAEKRYLKFSANKSEDVHAHPINQLLWVSVIGQIHRLLPSFLAQLASKGVKNKSSGEIWRQFKFNHDDKDSLALSEEVFYPLDINPKFRLGYQYAVSPDGATSTKFKEASSDHYQAVFKKQLAKFEDILAEYGVFKEATPKL